MKTGLGVYQQSKDLVFQAKATEEQIELLQEQQKLEAGGIRVILRPTAFLRYVRAL
jgi:hypothetical protein